MKPALHLITARIRLTSTSRLGSKRPARGCKQKRNRMIGKPIRYSDHLEDRLTGRQVAEGYLKDRASLVEHVS